MNYSRCLPSPRSSLAVCGRAARLMLTAVLVAGASSRSWAEPAKGTLSHASKAGPVVVNVKYAYLIKGPDSMSGKTMRQLILADVDLGSNIKACDNVSCATNKLESGMTVDFDTGQRLNFWFVANGQRIQASGTAMPDTMALSADTPQRIAGKWKHDASAQGGPKIDIEFDTTLVKEFAKAR